MSIDPEASKYPFQSAYVYAANNPITLIDNEGRGPLWFLAKYLALKGFAKITGCSIYRGIVVEAKAGVGAAGGGVTVSGGIAIDPQGNLALIGGYGFFAQFFGMGVQKGGIEGESSSSFVVGADGGLEEERSIFWGQNHVKMFAGQNAQWLSVSPGPGSVTLETEATGSSPQGVTVGAGPGEGEGMSYSRFATDAYVFAFTEKDIGNIAKASSSAFAKYVYYQLDNQWYDVSISTEFITSKNDDQQEQMELFYVVKAHNHNWNSNVVRTTYYSAIKVTNTEPFYYQTTNVVDPPTPLTPPSSNTSTNTEIK